MSTALTIPPPGFDALSAQEKLDYVQSLWDSIADTTDIPAPDWHGSVVQERLRAHKEDSAASRSWADARADLTQNLRAIKS